MIILSNALTDIADEGCRKVACSLTKRLKRLHPETEIVTYGEKSSLSDRHLMLGKWLLSGELLALLRRKHQSLLYIPGPAKMLPLAIRCALLSAMNRGKLKVILTMRFPVGKLAGWLLQCSGAELITLSADSWKYYRSQLKNTVTYLKAAVDTEKFSPGAEDKALLRRKYNLPENKTVVLHVGHLNAGRNVSQFLKLDPEFHGVLAVSTHTAHEQDGALKAQLQEKENITLIEQYLPEIQELYRLADVYLFPVAQDHSCIDIPLSAMEAAACGTPVVATAFGELKQLLGQPGFYEIDSFETHRLNSLLQQAAQEKRSPRQAVLEYDWDKAVDALLEE